MRPDSARQWWPRLFRVFPVCDSEPGRFSASSLVTTVPVTPCRIACFPFGTVTFITAASPAHCLLTEVEQPVRQGSGPGRGACAPSRTRQRNHLAAQTKKLCENLPEPLKTREKPGFWQDLQAGWREVPWNPLIPGLRERHQQRTKCSSVQITSGKGPGSLQPTRATP